MHKPAQPHGSFLKALTIPCFTLRMKGIASAALEGLWEIHKVVRL